RCVRRSLRSWRGSSCGAWRRTAGGDTRTSRPWTRPWPPAARPSRGLKYKRRTGGTATRRVRPTYLRARATRVRQRLADAGFGGPQHNGRSPPEPGAPMIRLAAMVCVVACVCAAQPASESDKPLVVDVWPGKVPDEPGTIGPEKVILPPKLDRTQVEVTEPTRMVTNVTKPTITVYRPAREKDTGTAVIICPGGGYWNLYWELEGEEVAAWLNSIGVTGVILKYRVPRRPDEPKGEPARRPLQDAERAVSVLRSKAKEWGIDPERIGMVGFSAGGHLTIATATSFDIRAYEPIDEIDRVSCRPDFAVLVYPGYLKDKDKD